MIGIGSRIRYERGPSANRWKGLIGVVTSFTTKGNINVDWENPTLASGPCGSVIALTNVSEVLMIDPTRAIQTTEDEPRVCRVIGVLERVVGTKTILVEVPWRHTERSPSTVEINFDGVPVKDSVGAALRFRNVPQRTSGFYPLERNRGPYGRGLIELSMAKSEYQTAPFFVEIVSVDGKPTEALIHAR